MSIILVQQIITYKHQLQGYSAYWTRT